MNAAVCSFWLAKSDWDDYMWLVWLGIIAVGLGVGWYLQRKRREELGQAAAQMGFSFDAEAASLGGETFLELPLLKRNSGLSNALRGSASTGEAAVLDVRVGHGKHSYTQTVACLRLAGKRLPAFELRPEHFGHKIAGAFGYQDIDFEMNPGFSKSYLLRGPEEPAVRALFQGAALQFFESEKGWSVEGAGDWLAVYRQGKTVKPRDLAGFLQDATRIAQVFAASV